MYSELVCSAAVPEPVSSSALTTEMKASAKESIWGESTIMMAVSVKERESCLFSLATATQSQCK